MYSAKSVSVSVLYLTPPSSCGSTKGRRSVSATKSPDQASAVSVRRASLLRAAAPEMMPAVLPCTPPP
eukprot:2199781-Pleurochrysis_carterae.AAC.1